MSKLVIVFDCGATNVRAVAVDEQGQIQAQHSMPNATRPDPKFNSGLIWDVDEIWGKFCTCFKAISTEINTKDISAFTVTTFGVNGAPVDKTGKLLYPVISWQCQRTAPIMDNIDKYISLLRLYEISGVNKFSFNTINVLIWLKENHPDILDEMEGFLFITSIIIHKLTGELVNDGTMTGTSMIADHRTRKPSEEILKAIDTPDKFLKIEKAGHIAGKVNTKAAKELGITEGIPVVLAGHDTQLALFGSGAGENEVVLSSGTWEILMTRSRNVSLTQKNLNMGITNELDAIPGLFNTGAQWLASGVLEWVMKMFYAKEAEQNKSAIYPLMIGEAMEAKSEGMPVFNPDMVNNQGAISGFGMHTTRGQIYRAALESLAAKTKYYLEVLQDAGKFKADSIIVVGGGSKNKLWNQLRANYTGVPVKIACQTETTVLGAALFAQKAIGVFNSIEEGVKANCQNYEYIYPEKN